MSVWRHLTRGLRVLRHRAEADREVADELAHYVEMATAEHLARGLSPEEARRAALLEVGNADVVRERVRSHGWEAVVDAAVADLRYAVRRACGGAPASRRYAC